MQTKWKRVSKDMLQLDAEPVERGVFGGVLLLDMPPLIYDPEQDFEPTWEAELKERRESDADA